VSWVNKGLRLLLENLNLIGFAVGLVLLYAGLSAWWVPAANIVAGAVLMAVTVWPYLRPRTG
jgi:putative effector of murein hydrolase LrgA (UPF0299 family)